MTGPHDRQIAWAWASAEFDELQASANRDEESVEADDLTDLACYTKED